MTGFATRYHSLGAVAAPAPAENFPCFLAGWTTDMNRNGIYLAFEDHHWHYDNYSYYRILVHSRLLVAEEAILGR